MVRSALLTCLLVAACSRGSNTAGDDSTLARDMQMAHDSSARVQVVSPQELNTRTASATHRTRSGTSASSTTHRSSTASTASVSGPRTTTHTVTEKHTKRDAAIGAVAGAALGAAVSKDHVKGGVIGAVGGGLIGGVLGNNVDKGKKTVTDTVSP